MKCTKCGRDMEENGVFCKRCLQTMAQYPIKPGTVIQLPQRKAAAPKKGFSRKRQLSTEEQLLRQRKTIRWLWAALICALLLLLLSASFHIRTTQEQAPTETIGQNYMTREAPTR